MIDFYYWCTPNGNKVLLFLEEAKLEYKMHEINIGKGDQFDPDFLKIAPNNRIPAIVDNNPDVLDKPISVFESGAILLYLAAKTGKFMPEDPRLKIQTYEWLMWQMGGQGPMFGQNHHFRAFAEEKHEYSINRYTNETTRLYNVLNRRLKGRDFVADEYSIADMAIYPWTISYERQAQNMDDYTEVKKWRQRIAERPATIKAFELGDKIRESAAKVTDEAAAKKFLYGQTDAKKPKT